MKNYTYNLVKKDCISIFQHCPAISFCVKMKYHEITEKNLNMAKFVHDQDDFNFPPQLIFFSKLLHYVDHFLLAQ